MDNPLYDGINDEPEPLGDGNNEQEDDLDEEEDEENDPEEEGLGDGEEEDDEQDKPDKLVSENDWYVRVGRLPGKIRNVIFDQEEVSEGVTVEYALDKAEADYEGYEIRVNGEPAELTKRLQRADTILLATKIKGNQ